MVDVFVMHHVPIRIIQDSRDKVKVIRFSMLMLTDQSLTKKIQNINNVHIFVKT